MDEKRPLTLAVEQAAEILGVARSAAYELVRSDVDGIRLRRRIVVTTKALAKKLAISLGDVWAVLEPARSRPAVRPPARPASGRMSMSQPYLFDDH